MKVNKHSQGQNDPNNEMKLNKHSHCQNDPNNEMKLSKHPQGQNDTKLSFMSGSAENELLLCVKYVTKLVLCCCPAFVPNNCSPSWHRTQKQVYACSSQLFPFPTEKTVCFPHLFPLLMQDTENCLSLFPTTVPLPDTENSSSLFPAPVPLPDMGHRKQLMSVPPPVPLPDTGHGKQIVLDPPQNVPVPDRENSLCLFLTTVPFPNTGHSKQLMSAVYVCSPSWHRTQKTAYVCCLCLFPHLFPILTQDTENRLCLFPTTVPFPDMGHRKPLKSVSNNCSPSWHGIQKTA